MSLKLSPSLGENFLCGPSAKDCKPQGAQPLQTGSLNISPDEDYVEDYTQKTLTLQFAYQTSIGVSDAVIHLIHISLSYFKYIVCCEGHVFRFFLCLQHNTAINAQGEAGKGGGWLPPICIDNWLVHHQHITVCEASQLYVRCVLRVWCALPFCSALSWTALWPHWAFSQFLYKVAQYFEMPSLSRYYFLRD